VGRYAQGRLRPGLVRERFDVGHGGAFSTHMSVNRQCGLVLVFLVQHAGFPGDGGKSQDSFTRAALEKYGKAKRAE
jgi:hypothetical protein